MDSEISGEEEKATDSVKRSYESKEIETKPKRRVTWRRAGLALLFILATAVVFSAGYLAVVLWQRYVPASFLAGPNPYENWLVYRSETHGLGPRYPDNWEATEANTSLITFQPKAQQEGEILPKDYVSLSVSSNAARGKTACESDQSACSFFANDIYGERITTPEKEIIFFAKGENDFTLAWNKYGEADYAVIFEEMGKSLRFITEENQEGNENP